MYLSDVNIIDYLQEEKDLYIFFLLRYKIEGN